MSAFLAARRWLSTTRASDVVERRQAILLQSVLVALIAILVVETAVGLIVPGFSSARNSLHGLVLLGPLFTIPLVLLRSGYFPLAATATVAVLEFIVVVLVFAAGPRSAASGVAFAIPMTIAALVLRRPGLVITTAISIAAIVVSRSAGHSDASLSDVLNLSITLGVLGIVLDRFGVSLRESLAGELRHHRELEATRVELVRRAEALTTANASLTREMTERAAAEEARRAIEAKVLEVQKLESLGVLAGGIAHDFNNLLVAIMGNAGLALLDLPEGSPARASIIDVEIASRRAGELARQMLAYSGRSRFRIEPVELGDLIRELLTLLQVSIGKGVILKLDLPPEPAVVDADAAQLRQVVMNLVINAADAIGDRSGTVTIRVERVEATAEHLAEAHPEAGLAPGNFAAIEITDTGMGMDRATQDRIFDPFFTTKFTGRGLGLAAVLGIVRSHGGAIRVQSEVGRGTSFRLLLPLSASSPGSTGDPDAAWRGEGRVLVVDDDPMVRSVARRVLESFGLTVRVVSDGPEAIERVVASGDEIDVVLLDMTMPEMSGPEVFARLHEIRPELPVVLMSGYHEDELAPDVGAGISGFVQKPFTPADLARRMRVALDSAAAGRTGQAKPDGDASRAGTGVEEDERVASRP